MNEKRIKYLFIIVLVVFVNSNTFGQEYTIKGTVKSDSIFLQVINVLNLTKMTGTVSDKQGSFTMRVHEGDSILFSSLVYVNRTIIVSQEHLDTGQMTVFLEPDYEQLDAVIIDPKFKIDYGNAYVPTGTVLDEDKISKKNGPDSRKLTDPNDRFSGVNFIGLIQNLTRKGRLKKKKERQAALVQQQEIQLLPQKLVNTYGENFFTNWLGIPKDKIFLFLDYCISNGLGEYLNSREIQMVDFLAKQSKLFIAVNQD